MLKISDIIGIIAVIILLIAFFMNIKKFNEHSKLYLIMNIVGAGLLAYASYLIRYYPFFILEFIWGTGALVQLVRLINHRKLQKS